MGSKSDTNPIKLFACVSETDEGITFEFGPTDHRSSVIPIEGIQRVFFSFERLIEADRLPEITHRSEAAQLGYLQNHRVVLDQEIIHFRNGAIEFLPSTHSDYRSAACQDFFLTMRRLYRNELRRMCILKR